MKKILNQIKPGYKVTLNSTRKNVQYTIYHFNHGIDCDVYSLEIITENSSLLCNIESVTPHKIIGYTYQWGPKIEIHLMANEIVIPTDLTPNLTKLQD